MLHFHLSSLGLVVAKKERGNVTTCFTPNSVSCLCQHATPAFIVALNFWLSLDIFQKGQKSSACSMTFTATDNCFLPSKRGGRMLTMTKEHSEVSQPFCRSLNDLPLSQSLKKNKRTVLTKLCMHINVSSVSK